MLPEDPNAERLSAESGTPQPERPFLGPPRLKGKVAVVTGAGKGIGRAIALAFAREGAHVVLAARTREDLEAVAEEIKALRRGSRPVVVQADLRREKDVERLQERAITTLGQVDILVNNVGLGKSGTVATLTTEDYDLMMNTNMRATWLCTKAFFPQMLERKDGTVIFIGSVAGLMGLPNEILYNASKFAQMGFAQSLDYEAYPNNVKVSVIAPGGVNTHFGFDTGWRTPGDPKLDTFLDADDVAEAAVFAAIQPAKSRVFLIGMRPMNEALTPGGKK